MSEKTADDCNAQESSISYYGWVVTAMAALANLVAYGIVFAFGVFLKPLAAEFGWSRSITAGPFSFYGIFHTILSFLTGRLTDRFGPRAMVLMAGLFIGLATLLMTFASSIWQLYIFYGLFLSIGVASNYAPMMSTVARWFSKKRGLAVGITAGGLGAGSLILSPVSAWLTSMYGWRVAYAVIGIACWLLFIPIVKFVKRAPQASTMKVSSPSSRSSSRTDGLTFAEAFKTTTFWVLCLTWLFAGITEWSIMIHLVSLITDRGVPLVEAGIIAAVVGVSSFAGRICGGFLSDTIGRKKVFICALSLQLLTTVWLLYNKETWMLFMFGVLFGLGMGGWTGVIGAFPADYFGFRATGAIFGFSLIFAGVATALGPYLGGYIFDTTGSYHYMIVFCIAMTAIAILFASLLRPVKK